MNIYEALLDEANNAGLKVKELPLLSSDGRIKGNKIGIRKDIKTSKKKACALAEEMGHHHTSVGDILDMDLSGNRKQEQQARLWAYNKLIGLSGIVKAFEHGCQNRFEIAEFLDVTEEFLEECVVCYRNKYGVGTTLDNYYIMFIPNLNVGRIDFSM